MGQILEAALQRQALLDLAGSQQDLERLLAQDLKDQQDQVLERVKAQVQALEQVVALVQARVQALVQELDQVLAPVQVPQWQEDLVAELLQEQDLESQLVQVELPQEQE